MSMDPIRIERDKNGTRRAWRYELRQIRWFPISLREAMKRLFNGTAYLADKDAHRIVPRPAEAAIATAKGGE